MKIVVGGYYGFGNLGDELILSMLKDDLNRRYTNPSITVLSAKPYKTKREHDLHAINRWDVWQVIKSIKSSQLFVLGGGGLFQDRTSGQSLIYYLALVFFARLFGVNTTIFSLGVDPISRGWLRVLIRMIIKSSTVRISVRDVESKAVLQEMGFKSKDISLVADPVFLYSVKKSQPQYDVFLIPRFPVPAQAPKLYHLILSYLENNPDLKWRFTLFQPEMEHKVISRENNAFSKVMDQYIFREDYPTQVDSLGKARFIISARFHGCVLAAKYGIPFVGLGDERKVVHLCHKEGMPHLTWNAQPKDVERKLNALLRRKELVK